MNLALTVPAFVAGLLTFLAPCTLPLVPGYLSFISGVTAKDWAGRLSAKARIRIFYNAILYVLGFSAVFILLGTAAGLGGAQLGQYRTWLARAGGIFVIFFGLYMLGAFNFSALKILSRDKRLSITHYIKPGRPLNSFLFGAVFALGWTPCVGPILGSILTLAASAGTAAGGTLLLGIFSLGLGLPFLLIAAFISAAARYINAFARLFKYVSVVGGIFLLILGLLMVTDMMGLWVGFFYSVFGFINYDRILEYL